MMNSFDEFDEDRFFTYEVMYAYCPRHPSEVISNGMFDAPCGGCEAAYEDDLVFGHECHERCTDCVEGRGTVQA